MTTSDSISIPRLLLGLHYRPLRETCEDAAVHYGFAVDSVTTIDEALRLAQRPYARYLVDINLGKPGSSDPEPSLRLYRAVAPLVTTGAARFIAISGSTQAVAAARNLGIPAEDKLRFDLEKFLH